jgi:uncharacterized membrane protein (UPF0136 family)
VRHVLPNTASQLVIFVANQPLCMVSGIIFLELFSIAQKQLHRGMAQGLKRIV